MKRGNAGDGKRRRRLGKTNKAPPPRAPVVERDANDDSESDVSDEDVKFVRRNAAYASFIAKGSFEEEEGGKRRRAGRERDADCLLYTSPSPRDRG